MKNPYHFNFKWLIPTTVILGFFMLGPCLTDDLCFTLRPRTENILLGILSSAILLLAIEFLNFRVDKWKFGFLKGKYKKQIITQKNDDGISSSLIGSESKALKEEKENIKFLHDTCYHELLYYNCDEEIYLTELNYQYQGIYTGTVEYLDHTTSDWKNGRITKIKATVTLNLNLGNRMTGSGSYKYFDKDDFGKFEFQVDEQDNSRIIVSYKNTIPSGLAEGYEVWIKT
ncbi:MAG: hypothetical protein JWQ09_762 [Segetibacter sp.]|nr:hypothetical protein [Segetibacter sp.]